MKAQSLLKLKLSNTDKNIQHEETVIEATEFVQVCYVKDEKEQNNVDVHSVEEREISISDSQDTFKKVEITDNYTSEVNALEISSNEENILEEVKISDRQESFTSIENSCLNNDETGHLSEASSDINESDLLYDPRPLTHKINTPRIINSKAKRNVENVMTDIAKADAKPKQSKPRKRRKDAEDHPNVFICDQCGNHFTCRHHFKLHLRRHTGDKQCACE